MMNILYAVLVLGVMGAIFGGLLAFAAKIFHVEQDPRIDEVRSALAGANCGGCGYAGCDALAKAISTGEAPISACPVGGPPVAAKIGAIMGQEAGEARRMVAFVKCAGDCEKTSLDYDYCGAQDCEMLSFVPSGGPKSCNYGCLGFGTCAKVCPFDAIRVINGVAVVDREACKACGKCVAHCPKHLIELVPYELDHLVACSSKDKGKQVMNACKAGCIGCKKCERACPAEAITVTDNVAHVDVEKCANCGVCALECPRKIITNIPEKK